MTSEYETSDEEIGKANENNTLTTTIYPIFAVKFDENVKEINEKTLQFIFSEQWTQLYFLGKITFKLLEGKIKYNEVNYDSIEYQNKIFTIWQSTAKSIEPITSTTGKVVIEVNLDESQILNYRNTSNKFRNLFYLSDSSSSFGLEDYFQILTQDDLTKFRKLKSKTQWNNFIEQSLTKNNNTVIALGAKNSGKSTFNKQLLETLRAHGKNVTFIDLDPGQQVFGQPACISRYEFQSYNEIDRINLGDSLLPEDDDDCTNMLIGSYDCNKDYQFYTKQVLNLIHGYNFGYQNVIVNMPGWMNGLGKDFLSLVIETIKSLSQNVDIVYLGEQYAWKKFNINVQIDFCLHDDEVLEPVALVKDEALFIQNNWNSTHLRQYRLFTLHDNNDPLLKQKPFRVSYGMKDYNIKKIGFLQLGEETPVKSEELTLLKTLPGSIIGIYKSYSEEKDIGDLSSIFKGGIDTEDVFLTLAVVHSINTNSKFLNVIVPERFSKKLNITYDSSFNCFKILTTYVGLPLYEFIPTEDAVIETFANCPPYTTAIPLKKHEHTWKVRKNIMRKGQK